MDTILFQLKLNLADVLPFHYAVDIVIISKFDHILKRSTLIWRHMATYILMNICSGNGLVPDGTKPLHEPPLTDNQRGSGEFFPKQFYNPTCYYVKFE